MKKFNIKVIGTLFIMQTAYGQVGTNGEDRSEKGRPVKEYKVGLVGVKYFTPYMFNVDVNIDHQLRPRIRIDKELLLFPRIFLEGEYEYLADFGWVNDLENEDDFEGETEWLIRTAYMLSRNFSIQANYNSHYGWGGGLSIRF
jgi:hypothetical protein